MNPISELQSPQELAHGLAPIWAAARVANPRFAVGGRVTFPRDGVFAAASLAWRENVFDPVLRPALLASLAHARNGKTRELAEIDEQLSIDLPASARAGSLRAGRRLASLSENLRGDRTLQRLAAWMSAAPERGHLATVFAARCAMFSITDRAAIGAYLFQEVCGGAPETPAPIACDFIAACLEPLFAQELRAA